MLSDYDDYQYNPCDEYQSYGDDYYIDDDGKLICACDEYPFDSYYAI